MPSDLPSASSTYVGKCVKSDSEIRYAWKSSTRMYVLQMEDGREFWFDSISCQWGDIDISHFYDVVPGKVITVRYIDFNYSLGSFAKKAVEIRDENEVFLSLHASARSSRAARITLWIAYSTIFVVWTVAVILYYSDEWTQQNLTLTASKPRQSAANGWTLTRRKRVRPPAPDAKKTAVKHLPTTGCRCGGLWHTAIVVSENKRECCNHLMPIIGIEGDSPDSISQYHSINTDNPRFLREAAPRGGHPVGLQEIHEQDASGGGHGRRLHCRLT